MAMLPTPDDARVMTRQVQTRLRRNRARWEALQRLIRQGRDLPPEVWANLHAVQRYKRLTTRKERRRLARLRRRFRMTFRKKLHGLIQAGRPEYKRLMADVKAYRRYTGRVYRNEIRAMKRLLHRLRRLTDALDEVRRSITQTRYRS